MNQLLNISVGCALTLVCTTAIAEEKLLQQCRSIKSELTRLESLRKGGGTAKQMDGWKRRMHDKQDEYSKLYCRQYRFELDKR